MKKFLLTLVAITLFLALPAPPVSSDELRTMQSATMLVSQATVNTATPNTYVLSYPTAVIYTNKPAAAWTVPSERANAVRLRFILKHASAAAEKSAQVKVYTWDRGYGGAFLACALNLTAGTGAITISPVTGEALATGNWAYVDTITSVTDNRNIRIMGSNNDNGIAEVMIDLLGASGVFVDFDCDANGTACTDVLCIAQVL